MGLNLDGVTSLEGARTHTHYNTHTKEKNVDWEVIIDGVVSRDRDWRFSIGRNKTYDDVVKERRFVGFMWTSMIFDSTFY